MRVGVIGTGNMGRALIQGLVPARDSDVRVLAHDSDTSALQNLPAGVKTAPLSSWAATRPPLDAVVIAVKPKDVPAALETFRSPLSQPFNPTWISIAAGVTISRLQALLGEKARICRVMPNTPALVGTGVSAVAAGPGCRRKDVRLCGRILGAVGTVVEVPERLMDTVTGLSGSGPAYVYLFIEALIEAGVSGGLSHADAAACSVQTVLGAARMVEKTGESPSVLKSRVMSPGGTTVEGLRALEEHRFKFAVGEAVRRAARRSAELGG